MSKEDEDLRSPRNAEEETRRNPFLFFLGAREKGTRGAVRDQEGQGQKSFVGSDTLPREMYGQSGYITEEVLKKAGVRFLGPVEDDALFQYVELPEGWEKVPTDHPMWSHLVNKKGRPRAEIFYKAAFYDRDAHLTLLTRFSVEMNYDKFEQELAQARIKDCGEVVHKTKEVEFSTDNIEEEEKAAREVGQLAAEWLDEEYPDWQNPAAYWD